MDEVGAHVGGHRLRKLAGRATRAATFPAVGAPYLATLPGSIAAMRLDPPPTVNMVYNRPLEGFVGDVTDRIRAMARERVAAESARRTGRVVAPAVTAPRDTVPGAFRRLGDALRRLRARF